MLAQKHSFLMIPNLTIWSSRDDSTDVSVYIDEVPGSSPVTPTAYAPDLTPVDNAGPFVDTESYSTYCGTSEGTSG